MGPFGDEVIPDPRENSFRDFRRIQQCAESSEMGLWRYDRQSTRRAECLQHNVRRHRRSRRESRHKPARNIKLLAKPFKVAARSIRAATVFSYMLREEPERPLREKWVIIP